MSDVSIKITIAGRTYPLSVQSTERDAVLQAAKLLNEEISRFEKEYKVTDKQDLLAMSALKISTLLAEMQHTQEHTQPAIAGRLNEIDLLLTEGLKG